MKRLIFLAIVAIVLTSFASLRSAEAVGPPTLLVCHQPAGVVVPVPNAGAVAAHERHGDCPTDQNVKAKPGDSCTCQVA